MAFTRQFIADWFEVPVEMIGAQYADERGAMMKPPTNQIAEELCDRIECEGIDYTGHLTGEAREWIEAALMAEASGSGVTPGQTTKATSKCSEVGEPRGAVAPEAEAIRKVLERLGRADEGDVKGVQWLAHDYEKRGELLDAANAKLKTLKSIGGAVAPQRTDKMQSDCNGNSASGDSGNKSTPDYLPYELIDSGKLSEAIRLRDRQRLLVLQPFGWHIDGRHIPNAAEHFSRESVCEDHGWCVVCDFGPYVAIVQSAAPPTHGESE